MFPDAETTRSQADRVPIPLSDIDAALSAQFVVAWAGESGEDGRLKWWNTDLVSEFGGEDLFKRLLPHTWAWATLQGAREAARRCDADLRGREHDADRLITLFGLGVELDERIDERLQELKRSGHAPHEVLPVLAGTIGAGWSKAAFLDWLLGHGDVATVAVPSGRLIKGNPPLALDQLVRQLVGALAPIGTSYPMPHFRKAA